MYKRLVGERVTYTQYGIKGRKDVRGVYLYSCNLSISDGYSVGIPSIIPTYASMVLLW